MPKKDGPLCKVCGASDRTPFPLFPRTQQFKFGEICAACDAKLAATSTEVN